MLLGINLLLMLEVNAARHNLLLLLIVNAAKHKLTTAGEHTHNMVAFMSKPAESEGFDQIADFMNAHTIKYALTVNLTIYTSCTRQFWATVKAKTVNGEVQLQALVDGKKIIITESIVRRDLQLEDAEGVDCLPNATIFEQVTLIGAKTTAWNEFSSTMASAIIYLATNQKFNFSKYIFESMVKNLDNAGNFLVHPRNMRRVEKGFSGRETPLFQTMVVHNKKEMGEEKARKRNEIDNLKRRVKRLEKKDRKRTHKLKRLYKLEQESSKKQKLEEDKESDELKQCLEIIPDDRDDVTIDAPPLYTKSPTIVDYKIYKEGKKSYFQIIREDVKARFKKTEPVNYMDNFLLRNLKTMFEHHVEDNVWKNQQGLVKVLNWKLYDSCGVYCVTMQNMLFYLLVEKMYPLTNHTLHQMFNDVKLQVDYECEMAFELLRLVKKQLKEGYVPE
ncbi:hypothetical protein Tco_0730828 [Tanacetum coccineum]